jgi:hypothetical protein
MKKIIVPSLDTRDNTILFLPLGASIHEHTEVITLVVSSGMDSLSIYN